MNQPTPNVDPKNKGRAMYDEADIGSGEKSPGQHETDEMIRGIPPLPPSSGEARDAQEDKQGDKPEEKREASGA